ncbi:MAG: MFS transporter [Acidisphaera sp.]|nr:MFS transporter [Acidisphaera sp.]
MGWSRTAQRGIAGLPDRLRIELGAWAAHALHDGFTDMIYALLPVWQAEFGLGYAALGTLRTLYTGSMAGLQVPVARLAAGRSGVAVLACGTALAGGGYLFASFGSHVAWLAVALLLSGAGSSVQHPIGSALVARAYDADPAGSRRALARYNFSGDLGKAALPAAMAAALAVLPWRPAIGVAGLLGLLVAACLPALLGHAAAAPRSPDVPTVGASRGTPSRGGFALLFGIGLLDSATRMGFLTFLPFLLRDKGADMPAVGLALALVFLGGAGGKLGCGWLGARVGVVGTVLLTEAATAACILTLLIPALPLTGAMALLPVLGVMLNGTSSVLYGSVPDLVAPEPRERGFALFYTGTIGSGAVSPALYGVLGDAVGVHAATAAVGCGALLTLPLALALGPALRRADAASPMRPASPPRARP